VEKDYKEVQAQKLAQQSAAEVLEAARKAGSLDDIAKDKKIEVKKTDWFSRREPDKNLKFRGESLNKVFQLQDSERFPSAPLTEVNNKFVVCQFLGRQTSDEGLEKEKDSIASRILMQKQAALWKSWMDEQRSKADIKMYRQL
jgi:hypothetical protein